MFFYTCSVQLTRQCLSSSAEQEPVFDAFHPLVIRSVSNLLTRLLRLLGLVQNHVVVSKASFSIFHIQVF